MPQPGVSLLSYPAAIPLSTRALTRLADLLRAHRSRRRCRWRRLDAGRQALLVLAHLRNGDTYARLAAGFDIAGPAAMDIKSGILPDEAVDWLKSNFLRPNSNSATACASPPRDHASATST